MSFFKCKFTLPPTNLTLIFFFFLSLYLGVLWNTEQLQTWCSVWGPSIALWSSWRGFQIFFIFCQNSFSYLNFLLGLPVSTEQTLGLSTIAYLEHLWGKISCFLLNVRLVNLRLMNRVPGPSHGGGSPRKERLAVFSWLQEGCLL